LLPLGHALSLEVLSKPFQAAIHFFLSDARQLDFSPKATYGGIDQAIGPIELTSITLRMLTKFV
jgi:hypothetical protein